MKSKLTNSQCKEFHREFGSTNNIAVLKIRYDEMKLKRKEKFMKRQLKVGNWYLKLSANQQKAFKRLAKRGNIQELRSFFTETRKKFGDEVEYIKNGLIKSHGVIYAFSHMNKTFYKLDN